MCLIAFAWLDHPRWALVLAANRDEFHGRPTASAAWWPDAPDIFGGRDLEAGGTWLAIDRRGRLAAVTNYREPGAPPGPRSRGELVADYLRSDADPTQWAHAVLERRGQWSGFNLLLFDLGFATGRPAAHGRSNEVSAPPAARPGGAAAVYLSNRAPGGPHVLEAGVHGLSNALLDCCWPKVSRLRERLTDSLSDSAIEPRLFEALADAEPAPDALLPATGLELERERLLSAAMIRDAVYGTRASTVVLVGHDGRVEFVERTWGVHQERPLRETRASFLLGH